MLERTAPRQALDGLQEGRLRADMNRRQRRGGAEIVVECKDATCRPGNARQLREAKANRDAACPGCLTPGTRPRGSPLRHSGRDVYCVVDPAADAPRWRSVRLPGCSPCRPPERDVEVDARQSARPSRECRATRNDPRPQADSDLDRHSARDVHAGWTGSVTASGPWRSRGGVRVK